MKNIKSRQLFEALKIMTEEDWRKTFDLLAAALEKKKVPCKLRLVDVFGNKEFAIECGHNYSSSVGDKAFDAVEACTEMNGVPYSVCAETSSKTDLGLSRSIAGGPKRPGHRSISTAGFRRR